MVRKRKLRLRGVRFLSICLALGTIGCGGAGTVGNGTASGPVPLTTNFRTFKPGDSYTYSIAGTFKPNGQPAVPMTGAYTVAVAAVNGVLVSIATTEQLKANGATYNYSKSYVFLQNPNDGSLVERSSEENGQTKTVVNTTFVLPGSLSSTTNASGQIRFMDGSTQTDTFVVEQPSQTPQIQTGLATFDTWEVATTSQDSTGSQAHYTAFYDPALGWFVQQSGASMDAENNVVTGTFTLTATTVPSSAWGANPPPRFR